MKNRRPSIESRGLDTQLNLNHIFAGGVSDSLKSQCGNPEHLLKLN